jgi:hypothetical protein
MKLSLKGVQKALNMWTLFPNLWCLADESANNDCKGNCKTIGLMGVLRVEPLFT